MQSEVCATNFGSNYLVAKIKQAKPMKLKKKDSHYRKTSKINFLLPEDNWK